MWGQRQAWNLLACQNTGVSAVHLDCRPDIITLHHLAARQKHASFTAAGSCRESFWAAFVATAGQCGFAGCLKSDLRVAKSD